MLSIRSLISCIDLHMTCFFCLTVIHDSCALALSQTLVEQSMYSMPGTSFSVSGYMQVLETCVGITPKSIVPISMSLPKPPKA